MVETWIKSSLFCGNNKLCPRHNTLMFIFLFNFEDSQCGDGVHCSSKWNYITVNVMPFIFFSMRHQEYRKCGYHFSVVGDVWKWTAFTGSLLNYYCYGLLGDSICHRATWVLYLCDCFTVRGSGPSQKKHTPLGHYICVLYPCILLEVPEFFVMKCFQGTDIWSLLYS